MFSTTATQNTRLICPLGSAIGKRFNTYFLSSPTTRSKRQPFYLQKKKILRFGIFVSRDQNGCSLLVEGYRYIFLVWVPAGRTRTVGHTACGNPTQPLFFDLPPACALSRGDDWEAVAAALRQVARSSSDPSPATSTTRYAHPLGRRFLL